MIRASPIRSVCVCVCVPVTLSMPTVAPQPLFSGVICCCHTERRLRGDVYPEKIPKSVTRCNVAYMKCSMVRLWPCTWREL